MAATQHLALAPKSDLTLLYGLAHLLIENGWIDRDVHRRPHDRLRRVRGARQAFTPERVLAATGLSARRSSSSRRAIRRRQARVVLVDDGRQPEPRRGRAPAQAIINLALMTGNIGRPGTGANSITGQCNAMGSRLFSNTTSLLGGRDFTSADDRAKIAGILGIDASRIPDQPSLAYDQIIDGIRGGKIKGLWVIATNPAHSWINQGTSRGVARRLDFLVVQDMYATTETAQLARPRAARRRLGREGGHVHQLRAAHRAGQEGGARPGQALADFPHLQAGRRLLGLRRNVRDWRVARGRVQILKEISRGQPWTHRRTTADDRRPAAFSGPFPLVPTASTTAASDGCSRTASFSTPTAADSLRGALSPFPSNLARPSTCTYF